MAVKRKVIKKRVELKNAVDEVLPETPKTFPQTQSIFTKALPIVYLALLLFSFGFGVLWQKVENLQSAQNAGVTTAGTQQAAQATPVPVSLDAIKGLFGKGLISFGDANRKVLFVAVEDPSCPYCHAAAGKNSEINNQFGPQFKLIKDGGTYDPPMEQMKKLVDSGVASLVYIYTPGHGTGEMAQKALYCAHEKGKFWQAHDLIYSNAGYELQNTQVKNDKTKSQEVANFLKNVVPAADMKSCLDSGKYDARLTSDTSIAAELGVFGTPGFFVNNTRFGGAYSFKDMQSTVDSALK